MAQIRKYNTGAVIKDEAPLEILGWTIDPEKLESGILGRALMYLNAFNLPYISDKNKPSKEAKLLYLNAAKIAAKGIRDKKITFTQSENGDIDINGLDTYFSDSNTLQAMKELLLPLATNNGLKAVRDKKKEYKVDINQILKDNYFGESTMQGFGDLWYNLDEIDNSTGKRKTLEREKVIQGAIDKEIDKLKNNIEYRRKFDYKDLSINNWNERHNTTITNLLEIKDILNEGITNDEKRTLLSKYGIDLSAYLNLDDAEAQLKQQEIVAEQEAQAANEEAAAQQAQLLPDGFEYASPFAITTPTYWRDGVSYDVNNLPDDIKSDREAFKLNEEDIDYSKWKKVGNYVAEATGAFSNLADGTKGRLMFTYTDPIKYEGRRFFYLPNEGANWQEIKNNNIHQKSLEDGTVEWSIDFEGLTIDLGLWNGGTLYPGAIPSIKLSLKDYASDWTTIHNALRPDGNIKRYRRALTKLYDTYIRNHPDKIKWEGDWLYFWNGKSYIRTNPIKKDGKLYFNKSEIEYGTKEGYSEFKEGGILKAQSGVKVAKDNPYLYRRKLNIPQQTENKSENKSTNNDLGKALFRYLFDVKGAKQEALEEGIKLTNTDWQRLAGSLVDLASVGLGFVPGANIASTVTGAAASINEYVADMIDLGRDGAQGFWGATGDLLLNLGMDAVSLIPGGKSVKMGKIVKTLTNYVPHIAGMIQTGQIIVDEDSRNAMLTTLAKLSKGRVDKMDANDFNNLAFLGRSILGIKGAKQQLKKPPKTSNYRYTADQVEVGKLGNFAPSYTTRQKKIKYEIVEKKLKQDLEKLVYNKLKSNNNKNLTDDQLRDAARKAVEYVEIDINNNKSFKNIKGEVVRESPEYEPKNLFLFKIGNKEIKGFNAPFSDKALADKYNWAAKLLGTNKPNTNDKQDSQSNVENSTSTENLTRSENTENSVKNETLETNNVKNSSLSEQSKVSSGESNSKFTGNLEADTQFLLASDKTETDDLIEFNAKHKGKLKLKNGTIYIKYGEGDVKTNFHFENLEDVSGNLSYKQIKQLLKDPTVYKENKKRAEKALKKVGNRKQKRASRDKRKRLEEEWLLVEFEGKNLKDVNRHRKDSKNDNYKMTADRKKDLNQAKKDSYLKLLMNSYIQRRKNLLIRENNWITFNYSIGGILNKKDVNFFTLLNSYKEGGVLIPKFDGGGNAPNGGKNNIFDAIIWDANLLLFWNPNQNKYYTDNEFKVTDTNTNNNLYNLTWNAKDQETQDIYKLFTNKLTSNEDTAKTWVEKILTHIGSNNNDTVRQNYANNLGYNLATGEFNFDTFKNYNNKYRNDGQGSVGHTIFGGKTYYYDDNGTITYYDSVPEGYTASAEGEDAGNFGVIKKYKLTKNNPAQQPSNDSSNTTNTAESNPTPKSSISITVPTSIVENDKFKFNPYSEHLGDLSRFIAVGTANTAQTNILLDGLKTALLLPNYIYRPVRGDWNSYAQSIINAGKYNTAVKEGSDAIVNTLSRQGAISAGNDLIRLGVQVYNTKFDETSKEHQAANEYNLEKSVSTANANLKAMLANIAAKAQIKAQNIAALATNMSTMLEEWSQNNELYNNKMMGLKEGEIRNWYNSESARIQGAIVDNYIDVAKKILENKNIDYTTLSNDLIISKAMDSDSNFKETYNNAVTTGVNNLNTIYGKLVSDLYSNLRSPINIGNKNGKYKFSWELGNFTPINKKGGKLTKSDKLKIQLLKDYNKARLEEYKTFHKNINKKLDRAERANSQTRAGILKLVEKALQSK